MAKYADLVQETTTTTGTGPMSLGGADTGKRTFVAGNGDGETGVPYNCTDGIDWEIGEGTVTAGSPDTLSRDTILDSTNGGAAVNWGPGTKTVANVVPANHLSRIDNNDYLSVDLSSGNVTLTEAQYRGYVLFRASGNTVARDLTLQAIKRLVVAHNDGSATLSVKLGSTTLTLAPDKLAILYTDGTTDGLAQINQTGGNEVATDSTTSYDALNTDNGKYIRLTNAGAKTVTFRPDSTHLMPPNSEWHFRNVGAGDATITEGAGVTINAPSGGTLVISQGMTVTVKRVAADEYDLIGQTVAA